MPGIGYYSFALEEGEHEQVCIRLERANGFYHSTRVRLARNRECDSVSK
jgi:hypothetical protein